MLELRRISNWGDCPCVVAASGPSLTKEVAAAVRRARFHAPWKVVAVSDAYRLMPWADVLYSCDFAWWRAHGGVKDFTGERWTSHSSNLSIIDDKSLVADEFDLNFVSAGYGKGFSKDPALIHYGSPEHSGFQAVNLAALTGCARIVLVGFDYGFDKEPHFFGAHPQPLRQSPASAYAEMARAFDKVETNVEILNATPKSNLKRFPSVALNEALRWDSGLYRHRAVLDARADTSGAVEGF